MGQPTSRFGQGTGTSFLREGNLAGSTSNDEVRATVGTWDWDLKHDTVRACQITRALFGVSREDDRDELPLWKFVQGIHRRDRKRFEALIEKACERGGVFEAEYRTQPCPGMTRRLVARGQFLANTAGIVERGKGVVIDVTNAMSKTRKPAAVSRYVSSPRVAPLTMIADHLISAWEIGRAKAPEDFAAIQPAFRALMLELGSRIAGADARTSSAYSTKRSNLH